MGAVALRSGKRVHEEPPAGPAAPHDVHAYSPQLLGELREEHRSLSRRHADIEKAVLAGRFASIPHGLTAFKAKFNVHILRESLLCYAYVRRRLARRPAELAAVTQLQQRADAIGRQVVDFVEKYRTAGVARANAQEFLDGLRAIGRVLAERNEREEAELFALYRP